MLILYDNMTKVYRNFGDIGKPGNLGSSLSPTAQASPKTTNM